MTNNTNGRITIRDVYELLEKLESKIERDYVHKTEFAPVKSLVYGLVGVVMMAVGTAVVATVIRAAQVVIESVY